MEVSTDFTQLDRKFGTAALRMGRLAAANDAHQAMERFVPKLSGDLRSYSNVTGGGTGIQYTMPYAKPQFYGLINGHPVTNYSEPETSKRWDLRLQGDAMLMKQVSDAFIKGANW